MKKIICLLAVVCCSYTIFAQDSSMNNDKATMQTSIEKMKDGLCMKDGKMMATMNGKTMMMDKDMTLKNGTMVMTDGTVKMKDGTTKMMKEGDMISMKGKMSMMKMDDNKMMAHDSTTNH